MGITSNSQSNTAQAFWVGIGSLSTFAFTLISTAILSRYLDKSDYGTYKQVMYVYNTLLFVFTLGLPKAYSYFLPRYPKEEGLSIVKKINGIFLIMGLVFGMLLYWGSPIIAHVLNNEQLVTPLKFFALTPAFLLPTMGLDGIMAVYKKTIINAVYLILTRIIMLLFVCLPVVLYKNDCNYAIIGFTISSFICLIFSFFFEKLPFKGCSTKKSDLKYRDVFNFALPLLIASFGGVAIKAADQFFVSRYFGAEVFADFSNGSLELPFVGMVLSAGAAVLLPLFSKYVVDGPSNKGNILVLWSRSLDKAALILYPLVVYCFVFASLIMTFLYGDQYATSAVYFRIMFVVNIFTVAQYYPIIIALGATKYYARVHVYMFILVWTLDFLSIIICPSPYMISIISVLCHLLKIFLMAEFIAKSLGVNILNLFPIKYLSRNLLVCIISAFIVYKISKFIPCNGSKFILLIVSFSIYSLLVLLGGLLLKINYLNVIKPLIKR